MAEHLKLAPSFDLNASTVPRPLHLLQQLFEVSDVSVQVGLQTFGFCNLSLQLLDGIIAHMPRQKTSPAASVARRIT